MSLKDLARLIAVALPLALLGADAPPRTIDAGGLTFRVPASWKSSRPSSSMRRAQLTVDPVPGDTHPAELVVFAFPGGAGTVEANVQRWREQFQDQNGNPPKIVSEKRKGDNIDVTYVETAGRYVAAMRPGSPQRFDEPGYHLLGAIVESPEVAYFVKMVGPDKTVTAAKPAFNDLVASIRRTAEPR